MEGDQTQTRATVIWSVFILSSLEEKSEFTMVMFSHMLIVLRLFVLIWRSDWISIWIDQ